MTLVVEKYTPFYDHQIIDPKKRNNRKEGVYQDISRGSESKAERILLIVKRDLLGC